MGLCLTIKKGQRLFIGDDIVLTVTKAKGSVGVSIDAPDHVRILREGVEPTGPADEKMETGPCLTDEERRGVIATMELCRTALDDCNRADVPSVGLAQAGISMVMGDAHAARPARLPVGDPIIECLCDHGMPDYLSTRKTIDWLKVTFMDAETETLRLQAIGERLPKDAAGNVKLPGDMMYGISPGGRTRKGELVWAPCLSPSPGYHVWFGERGGPIPVEECYSTIQEAEAAREAGI
jgi:sRNA-binding carbon storage regulator CsrA